MVSIIYATDPGFYLIPRQGSQRFLWYGKSLEGVHTAGVAVFSRK